MTFLSLNHISLFGRVASAPTVTPIGRVRAITLGVETDDEGGARVHRVVIQDEFLAKAMQDRLVEGAAVQVLGELDYDDVGAFVSITQRRGSDVHVLAGEASAPVQAVRPPAPPARPASASVSTPAAREPQADPQPSSAQAASPAAPPPVRTPPPAQTQTTQPPRPAPTPSPSAAPAASGGIAAPPRRPPFPPSAPTMPAPPRPAPPGRPAGGALSGLQSGARTTQVEDPFPGDAPSAGVQSPKPNGGGKAYTGPDSLDDDIPF